MNGLFADVHYNGVAGVPRDFVELPSQIMEHWVFEPEVLKVYAKHHETGEVIPQAIVDKIVKSVDMDKVLRQLNMWLLLCWIWTIMF